MEGRRCDLCTKIKRL